MVEQSQDELLEDIMERMKNSGDLPIFSASVNRVQLVGSDPDSNAMNLAMEVLKDANLTTKVLKLANSSYYNRGTAKIAALSRAIVMLGFDTIRSTVLTMKMIESFQYEHPAIDMNAMMVNAYMSAGFVREIASECGLKDVEQSYVCGLLHNLGEVVIAYTMPEEYLQIQQLVAEKGITWVSAQKKVLGAPLRKIGKYIVEKWEFPSTVANTLSSHTQGKKISLRDKVAVNRSLASLSTSMMDLLYSEKPMTNRNFTQLTRDLTNAVGLNSEVIEHCLEKSFKQSCDLAEEYGLDKQRLIPKLEGDGKDKFRDKMAHQLGYYIMNKVAGPNQFDSGNEADEDHYSFDDGYDDVPQEVLEFSEQEHNEKCGGDANILLSILHELTGMMANKAQLNSVFKKILEGICAGVGFDRALFCFVSPDHKSYSGRLVYGKNADELKEYFCDLPLNPEHDLFSKIIMEGNELVVSDVGQSAWSDMLPADFSEIVAVNSFVLASIRVNNRPLGLVYADKVQQNTPISADDNRGFVQLVGQVQLALQVQ